MPKVSVVVPIYNVEAYIEKCANSLFLQTLDDMEYIFVNDCTKDNSMQVLNDVIKRFPNRKNQIKIINHQTNKGLPQARKSGIEASTGEYIIHCDSDDWVDLNLYEMMYKKAVETGCDMVACDFCVVTSGGEKRHKGITTKNKDALVNDMLFYKSSLNVWNKLYKREIYDYPILFPEENMGEDMATTFQLINYCKKIERVSDVYYYYNGTTISISREETKDAIIARTLQVCKNAEIVLSILDGSKYKDGFVHLKYHQRRHLMPIINDKEAFGLWNTIYPEINMDVLFNHRVGIPFMERLKFFLTLVGIFPIIKQYTRKNIC